jgi:ATP-dependent Clp protease protease subunit
MNLHEIHEYGVDLKNNHIYIHPIDRGYETDIEGVDHMMASRFLKNINICKIKNPNKPLTIHLQTYGGIWNEGMAIYDTIKSYPQHVTIINYTHARSMSSLIFSAGDERIMMPNSYFMFHLGTWGMDGEYHTVKSNMKFDEQNELKMINIYSELMNEKGKLKGKGIEYISKWIRKQMAYKGDVFFNAQQTVDYGLADKIL